MGKKITGRPRFDSVQLMKVRISRIEGPVGDKIEADIAFVDTNLPLGKNMCGSFTMSSELGHTSKKTDQLASKLVASLEEDVLRALFNETTQEEQEQEGIHVQEPKGIADAEEEGRQV